MIRQKSDLKNKRAMSFPRERQDNPFPSNPKKVKSFSLLSLSPSLKLLLQSSVNMGVSFSAHIKAENPYNNTGMYFSFSPLDVYCFWFLFNCSFSYWFFCLIVSLCWFDCSSSFCCFVWFDLICLVSIDLVLFRLVMLHLV
jgi:hypothetical protein